MRKGRSQRKTRGSLPPISQKRQPSTHSGEAGGGGPGPQVVIGLTAPPPAPSGSSSSDSPQERLETRSAEGPLTNGESSRRPTISTLIQGSLQGTPKSTMKLEVLAEPTLELVREAERLELVREQNLELVRESLELVRETLDAELASSASEEQEPELAAAAPERETEEYEQEEAHDSDPQPAEERTFELIESEPPPALASHPTPSEMSIPPAGDLAVEPIADQFFSEGELVASRSVDDDAWDDDAADKVQRKSLPHVIERRARFSKYVRWAVGGAAIVCVAAFARTIIMPSAHPSHAAAAAVPMTAALASLEAPAPKAAPATLTTPTPPEPAKTAEPAVPAAEAPAAAAPTATATTETVAKVDAPRVDVPAVPPAADPAAAAKAAAPAVATGDKTALEEKKDARRALERGKLADSIAAGERSVVLDPTDGEAWLLLGAAYQEKGKNAEARRCYSSCLKEGKRGPLGECRAMLR